MAHILSWMKALLLVAAALLGLGDASRRGKGIVEQAWSRGDFVVGTSDKLLSLTESGDVVALQIEGAGESCLLRRKRFALEFPCRVRFRMRAKQGRYGEIYPSVHLLFDPPALDDPWWKSPVEGKGAGAGAWRDGRTGFVFHFSTDATWRRFGRAASLEQGGRPHAYGPPRGAWVMIEVFLEAKRIRVEADGVEVASMEDDLASVRAFAAGVGDQASTLVELDELRVISRARRESHR